MTTPLVDKLRSGGYLVHLPGEGFPVWRADMPGVRRLLLNEALASAPSRGGETATAPTSPITEAAATRMEVTA